MKLKELFPIKKKLWLELDNQTILKSDNVICNADPPAVYEKMLNGNTNNSFLLNGKRMEYSMGLFVYYFGTKKV